tara:strand:- start:1430 stop:1669 length:240 start_codon:yes stop_codon:yes gene_type:complete
MVIFLAFSLAVYSSMKFVADMQMQVARHAYINKEITMAKLYSEKAMRWNPFERRYLGNTDKINRKYTELITIMKNKETK